MSLIDITVSVRRLFKESLKYFKEPAKKNYSAIGKYRNVGRVTSASLKDITASVRRLFKESLKYFKEPAKTLQCDWKIS